MNRPLLHVGYPKTGTTWLQRHLFPNEAMGFGILGRKLVKQALVYPHALAFDVAKCQRDLRPCLDEIASRGLVPVISMERLSGDPHAGGYDSKEMADRLHRCYPHGRVLIAIREQRGMLLSLYRQYVQAGGPARLHNYLIPTEDPEQRRMNAFDFDHFKYHRLIEYYVRLFGRANVLVLAFEQLKDDPLKFVEAIRSCAGAHAQPGALQNLPFGKRENEGKSPIIVGLKRRLNVLVIKGQLNPWTLYPIRDANKHWRRSLGGRLESMLPRWLAKLGERKARHTIQELVGDRYRDSNARTAEYVRADLASLGYDVVMREVPIARAA